MGLESGPPKASAVGPIVIACAFAEAPKVRQVAASLGKQGYTVEVVSGVELDPRALSVVADRCRSQGVYVLCRSTDLDRDKVEALREVLLAHRVPFGRTITVATTSARELEERIEQGLGRAAGVRPPTPTRPPVEIKPSSVSRPTVIAPATLEAALTRAVVEDEEDGELVTQALPALNVPIADDDTPEPEREPEPERPVGAAETSLTEALDPGDIDYDDVEVDSEPELDVRPPSVIVPPPKLDIDFADIDALDSRRGMPAIRLDRTEVGPAPQPASSERTEVGPAPVQPPATGTTVPSPAQPRPPLPFDSMPPELGAATPPTATPALGVDAPRRGMPIKAIVGTLSAAGVIAILWSFIGGGSETATDADAPTPDGAKQDGGGLAKSSSGDAGDRSQPPKPTDDARAHDTMAEPGPTRVGLALRQRTVRALDILLIASKPSKPLTYSAAEQHCAALDIEGLRGWRLPEVGELGSLGAAGIVGGGTYWSHTAGDTFGDMRLVYNGKNGRIQPRVKESLALCVRGDRATQ